MRGESLYDTPARLYLFLNNQLGGSRMLIEKYYKHASAEYFCNVNEFINTGQGRKLTRLQNLKIRTKYPKVEQWHKSLNDAGRERIDRSLVENYGV
jgi:hypothetical protein